MEVKDRRGKLLDRVDVARMVGLEIGPLCRPVVSRGEGRIHYLDHASRAELEAKYAGDPNVDPEAICEVDFVWQGATLRETIPGDLTFDYVIASHVIEHVPDVIGWLGQLAAILRPEGVLSLAIPDRRYSFDYLRRTTTISELVESHLHRATRPSPRQAFDFCAHAIEVDTAAAWRPGYAPDLAKRFHTDQGALQVARGALEEARYVDVHCTVYTADSFLELWERLIRLGLVDFEVASFFAPDPGTLEFFVTLRKLPPAVSGEERVRRQLESLPKAPPPDDPRPASTPTALEVEALRAQLDQVHRSWSWRLTRPLRAVTGRVAAARRALAPLRHPDKLLRKRAERRLLRETPLFDADFYIARHADVASSGLPAVEHYLRYGAAEGRDPHPLFDTAYYLGHGVPDLEDLTPLGHYLLRGSAAGRKPNALFDPAYYAALHPDGAVSGEGPLLHYLRVGRAAGRRTHPLFDPAYYRRRHADAGPTSGDALAHYLRQGLFEDRDPNPLFDVAYYRAKNPDVVAAGLNPVDHYLHHGAREGRNPSPLFDTRLYLHENPAVAAAGRNPLEHFLGSLPALANPRRTGFAYRSWLAAFPARERWVTKLAAEAGEGGPLVSLVTAAAAASELPPEAVAASVFGQRYPRWEWRVAVPRRDPALAARARERYGRDPRVQVVESAGTDPAALLRSALQAATGEYVAILGPDGVLAPDALGALVAEALRAPAAVVYGDEDRLDEHGRREQPYFKPSWTPDLFLAGNYLGRPTLLRRALVESVGAIEVGASPAPEYDLLLRATAAAKPGEIRHLPAIVGHRLPPPGKSDSARGDAVPGRAAEALVPEPPLVSLVIPSRDRLPLLRACLESLLRETDYPRYEILVVDNDTKDADALGYLAQLGSPVRVIRHPGPFDHSALNNHAVAEARGSVLVLLNNDTTVKNAGWLTEMVRLALRPDVGAVGAKLYYPDGSIQHAGVVIGINGVAGHAFGGLRPGEEGYFGRERVTHEYSAVTAACLAIRREVYDEVKGFDALRFPVNFNDVDLCLRIRGRGYKVLYCATAELVHAESASRRNEDGSPIRETAFESPRFRERWPDEVEDDPFYNPNLSLAFSFELAIPPRPGPRRL